MNGLRFVLLSALILLVSLGSAKAQPHRAVEVLTEYLDHLQSYNHESAQYLWTEAVQERSARFGIKYEGITIKADCTSPMMQSLDRLRHLFATPVKQTELIAGNNFIKLTYTIRDDIYPLTYDYYAQKIGDYYWLSVPQDYFAKDWPVVVTKYFRIHVHPSVEAYVHRPVLDELDRFVEKTAEKLKFDSKTLDLIKREKIEYFYCDSDKTVKQITGHLTKGVLDLATNDIISASFPHFHELVHLLINIHLREIPLVTLPILREGLAVKYGGRWGKRPEALSDLAGYLYREHFVELDSILSYDDFLVQGQADMAYPISGQFVAFLMDHLGYKKFFKMYRFFSGSVSEVREWDAVDVKEGMLKYTSHKDWLDLVLDFDAYLDQRLTSQRVAAAGLTPKAKLILTGPGYEIFEDDEWYCFRFQSESTDPSRGNLLFGNRTENSNLPSSLFEEQYRGQLAREGYRFGVRYDQYEAGLYDYVTQELAAKYILSITPSNEYYDPDTNIITFRIRKSMVGKELVGDIDCRLLPN